MTASLPDSSPSSVTGPVSLRATRQASGTPAAGTKLWLGLLLAAAAGATVTGYLTYTHFAGVHIACFGGGGCEQVQASRFAFVFNVPIALLGRGFYITSFGLSLGGALRIPGWERQALPALFVLALAATLFSGYLVALQLLVIHALCAWCLASVSLATSSLVMAVALLLRW